MVLLTKHWPPLLTILASLGAGFLASPYLPDRIPVRWGIDGSITTYADKELGVYLNPAAMVIAFLFFTLIPYSDRRRVRELRSLGVYEPLRNTAVYAFAFSQSLAIGIGLGILHTTANYVVGIASLLTALCAHAVRSGLTEPLKPHVAGYRSASPVEIDRISGRLFGAAAVGLAGALFAPYPLAWLLVPILVILAAERIGPLDTE